MFIRYVALCVLSLACVLTLKNVEAQVMSSPSYQLQSDSLNFGGGLSSSSNYVQESTFGEVGTGPSDSTSYSLRAGYQQMQEIFLSLSGGENVTMSPDIPGVTGGIANGSTTLTAITDSPSGYRLTIESSDNPAMKSVAGDTIADYVPSGGDPDLYFTTDTADAHFGYSPFGEHVAQRFQTDGNDCNVSGSGSSTSCWDGLSSTTPTEIARSTSPNQPDGSTTTIYFRVGVGSSVLQPPGDYSATTTVTLLPL